MPHRWGASLTSWRSRARSVSDSGMAIPPACRCSTRCARPQRRQSVPPTVDGSRSSGFVNATEMSAINTMREMKFTPPRHRGPPLTRCAATSSVCRPPTRGPFLVLCCRSRSCARKLSPRAHQQRARLREKGRDDQERVLRTSSARSSITTRRSTVTTTRRWHLHGVPARRSPSRIPMRTGRWPGIASRPTPSDRAASSPCIK